MAKASAKAAPKTAAPKAPKAAPAAAAPASSDAGPAADPVTEDAKPAGRARGDVVHFCYDNEHEDGVHCTLTFQDGATVTGSAPSTGSLADDQAAASANALDGAA